jgi:N-acetylglucosaminyldiphosphoundecaprenol N-acetyl-beta-D-mannosaminyltransferase
VTGVELTPLLLHYAQEHDLRVYVLGASEEASTLAIASILRTYPGLMVKGRDGYFAKEQEHTVVEDIRAFAPHLLLVGLGQPRQEVFIDCYRETLGVPLAIGVGGTIDILAGTVKRSPQFFQQVKLEWLYRLLKEPRRFRRQLALPVFAWEAYWDARRRSTT